MSHFLKRIRGDTWCGGYGVWVSLKKEMPTLLLGGSIPGILILTYSASHSTLSRLLTHINFDTVLPHHTHLLLHYQILQLVSKAQTYTSRSCYHTNFHFWIENLIVFRKQFFMEESLPLPVTQGESLQADPKPQHRNENKRRMKALADGTLRFNSGGYNSDSDSDSELEDHEVPFRPRLGTLPIEVGKVTVGRWTIETERVPREGTPNTLPLFLLPLLSLFSLRKLQ